MPHQRHILTLICPNRPGNVATSLHRRFESGRNILDSGQVNDGGEQMADGVLNRRALLGAGCGCCIGAAAWPRMALAATADPASAGLPQLLELGADPMTRIAPTVWVRQLAPGLWLHTTTALIAGGVYYPANGLILERPGGSLLIDTTYSPEQAETLLAWSGRALAAPIRTAIATHFHNDRTGGIDGLRRHGVETLARPLTCDLARAHGLPTPGPIEAFTGASHRLDGGGELFFPGAGHTRDNVTAWFPGQKVLFGGCFVKSVTSHNLGNIADAVVGDWAASARRAQARYPGARVVVPGHGTIAGDPLARTLALLG